MIEEIRSTIRGLNLYERYYNILRDTSKKLHDKNPGYYDEDGNFIDVFNPDAYIIRFYLIQHEDKLYLGNEQIPNDEYDNTERTTRLIDYWFRGDNCNNFTLYEIDNVHNKSINKKGYGCNQFTLSKIKAEIIEKLKTVININVNDIPKDEINFYKLYGKHISMYKANLRRNILKNMPQEEFAMYVSYILNDIIKDKYKWANMLRFKNRYWLISKLEEDIQSRNDFFKDYEHVDDKYIAILVLLKEVLFYHIILLLNNKTYISVFSKLNYITNNICSVKNLYNLNSLYTDKTAIRLLMSIQYKHVYDDKLIETYKNFLSFKRMLYKQIYS